MKCSVLDYQMQSLHLQWLLADRNNSWVLLRLFNVSGTVSVHYTVGFLYKLFDTTTIRNPKIASLLLLEFLVCYCFV